MRQLKIEERITARTVNIDRYFNDVNTADPLTPDEEYKIAVLATQGDKKATDILIRSNLRFVISVAKQYAMRSEMLGELIAQGNVGLIEAATKFDPSRGFRFISFAVWFIRKEILRYLRDNVKVVRLPHNIILDINRAKKVETRLATKLGREATIAEIEEEMKKQGWDITTDKIKFIKDHEFTGVPLEPVSPEDEWAPIQWMSSDDSAPTQLVDMSDSQTLVNQMLSVLTPVERQVVEARLGLVTQIPEPFSAIAEKHKKSSEWARILYAKAIKKAASYAKRHKLNLQ